MGQIESRVLPQASSLCVLLTTSNALVECNPTEELC
jgi:hypothetical protein